MSARDRTTAQFAPARAWVLLQSGARLDLLDPDPMAWDDADLATGLARTYRWGGHSKWDLPLSVAQHSLTVLALRQRDGALSQADRLCELLHDAEEGLLGYDAITPLKPHLGPGFQVVAARLTEAVRLRYGLPAWSRSAWAAHKQADRLAAASEAAHVVGWSRHDLRHGLGITVEPLAEDPLARQEGLQAWEPWPPRLAAATFLTTLRGLLAERAHETATRRSTVRPATVGRSCRQPAHAGRPT